jgi:predicted Zn-dependent protease
MSFDTTSRQGTRPWGWTLLLALPALLTAGAGNARPAGPPSPAETLKAGTRSALESYRVRDALAFAMTWVERSPKSARAWFWRGRVYERVGQLADARHDYRRALELDPKDAEARLRLGEVLLEANDPPRASKHFELLHKRRRDDPDVLLGLARCRFLTGRPDDARELLDKLLKKHPHRADALAERGKLALQEARFKDAEAYLRKAVDQDPASPEALFFLALCLRQGGKNEEAKRYLDRYQRLHKDLKRLERIVREGLPDKPKDPALRLEAGTICLRLGRTKEGLRLLHLALKADPRHRPTHRALADYYERTGEKAKAAHHRKLAGGGGK